MHPRRYVVNADDFGMSVDVNDAIVRAFDRGLVSSSTIMANMPGFEHACDLVRERRLQGKIGVHLNLTEGTPLTTEIRSARRFVHDNRFEFALPRSTLTLTAFERAAVRTEWVAQVRRCLEHGVSPTHFDSHQHVHTVWPLLSIAIAVARQFDVRSIRLSRNVGESPGVLRGVYKAAMNARLRAAGLANVRHFGGARDLLPIHRSLHGDIEVMVHPRMEGDIVVDLRGTPVDEVIRSLGIAGDMRPFPSS